ncbi:MAG: apolipoprotein N-acyltransferase [Gemmatimonadota bacterium]|nr:apolipoprotein N-acyltransferase [Gemmatimonadota bacterium]MDE2984380.1 apolipoprotein N-acyltransferase [Gemmatimonadota bacterium]
MATGRPRGGGGVLLAVASGVAIGATFSPFGGPVLPFLAFAPLAMALAPGRSGSAPAGPAAPFVHGFLAAATAHAIGLYWMVPALAWRTRLAVPVYLLVVAMLGVLGGAACAGALALHRRRRWPLPVALAACWTGFEWAATHVPGVSYAWLNAGGSLGWHPSAAAGVEVLGARFLTFWTVAVGGGVGVIGLRLGKAGATALVRPAVLLSVVAGVPLVAGQLRQRTFEGGDVAATVAAVQAGHGGGGAEGAAALERWLEPLRELRVARPFDVAVFPERFLAAPLGDREDGTALPMTLRVADFAGALGAATLVGALDIEPAENGRDTVWYNAAFVQPAGGALSRAYRKDRLVPGLENTAVPEGAFGLTSRGYGRGRDPRPLPLGGGAVGAMVCYDSAYGPTARALVRRGAEWLAVLSNDDWLDPDKPFRATWAYWQHATHARLRAMENRVSVVQVAATGHTFAVSPGGRASASALEAGEEGIAVLPVRRRGAQTLYTRLGDVLGLACFAVFALGVVVDQARGTRGRHS